MRPITGGLLVMGGQSSSGAASPKRTVHVQSFHLGATPVTNALWNEFAVGIGMDQEPHVRDRPADVPVTDFIHSELFENGHFFQWVKYVSGQQFTLPTEEQWEYAAKGLRKNSLYPWGNTYSPSRLWSSIAGVRLNTQPASVYRTKRIYTNDFGLVDMCGNVWDLCQRRDESFPGKYPPFDSSKPISRENRLSLVIRGGSFKEVNPLVFTTTYRRILQDSDSGDVSTGDICNGFRLARLNQND
jgi:formylglycine-generating enzyme required for sulfatase activity